MTRVSAPVRILVVALGLGYSADYLFYGQRGGLGTVVFVLLLLGALFAIAKLEKIPVSRHNLWLVVPILFCATMLFVRANSTLAVLNTLSLVFLMTMLAYFWTGQRVERLGLLGYPVLLATTMWGFISRPAPVLRNAVRQGEVGRERIKRAAPLARGALLAVPVLALFTALLSSADSIFAGYVGNVLSASFINSLPDLVWRQVMVFAIAWVVAGGLLFALRRRTTALSMAGSPAAGTLPSTPTSPLTIGFLETSTVLTLVSMLFLVFAWIQFTVLFSGEAARSMDYEAYREYVRRGFGELLVVAILTMVLILGLRWASWKETSREILVFKGLSSLMIGLALVMLVSALMRMLVWENVQYYISTEVRIYVRVFIVWLGLMLLWLLLSMWLRPGRFAIGALICVLGFLGTVNLMNTDADVASYNLRHSDDLATRYVDLLSDDAIPALVAGYDKTSGWARGNLYKQLAMRLWELERDPTRSQWQSFHLARDEAYRSLVTMRDAGKLSVQ